MRCGAERSGGGATEASEVGAEAAGPRPPASDGYMYVCGDAGGGARYECAYEPNTTGTMDQPPFEEHMFAEFGKDRHVHVLVGSSGGELSYREEIHYPDKRKEEPLLLQPSDQQPAPPQTPTTTTTTTTKKSEKKKNDNNGIKKKKTR